MFGSVEMGERKDWGLKCFPLQPQKIICLKQGEDGEERKMQGVLHLKKETQHKMCTFLAILAGHSSGVEFTLTVACWDCKTEEKNAGGGGGCH